MNEKLTLVLITLALLLVLLGLVVLKQNLPLTGQAVKENFNLKVEIPNTYKKITAGEEIWFTMKLINLANVERIDITLLYEILNEKKEVIASRSETVAVETQASFVGSLKIPSEAVEGKHDLRVTLSPEDDKENNIQSQVRFKVVESSDKSASNLHYYLFIILSVAIVLIYLSLQGKKLTHRAKIRLKVKKIVNQKLKTGTQVNN